MFEADQWKIILLNWIQKIGIHVHPGKWTSKIRNDPTEKEHHLPNLHCWVPCWSKSLFNRAWVCHLKNLEIPLIQKTVPEAVLCRVQGSCSLGGKWINSWFIPKSNLNHSLHPRNGELIQVITNNLINVEGFEFKKLGCQRNVVIFWFLHSQCLITWVYQLPPLPQDVLVPWSFRTPGLKKAENPDMLAMTKKRPQGVFGGTKNRKLLKEFCCCYFLFIFLDSDHWWTIVLIFLGLLIWFWWNWMFWFPLELEPSGHWRHPHHMTTMECTEFRHF